MFINKITNNYLWLFVQWDFTVRWKKESTADNKQQQVNLRNIILTERNRPKIAVSFYLYEVQQVK